MQIPPIWLFSALVWNMGRSMEVVIPSERVFRFPFSPEMFNLTGLPSSRIEYVPAMKDRPDMPPWMRYKFSRKHNTGFIYGVPPKDVESVILDVIALDTATYNVRKMNLFLNVTDAATIGNGDSRIKNLVTLKIDNLNLEDMFEAHRLRTLKSIFKRTLWPDSSSDLHLMYVSSSLDLGYRRPLNPDKKDGVVVRLGSNAEFSTRLTDLNRETGPLRKKFPTCPTRNFIRTSAERHFRLNGFALDWCAFQLLRYDERGDDYKEVQILEVEGDMSLPTESPPLSSSSRPPILRTNIAENGYEFPVRSEIPSQDLASAYIISVAAPATVLLAILVILAVLFFCKIYRNSDVPNENEEWDGFLETFYSVLGDCCRCCCFRDVRKSEPGRSRAQSRTGINYLVGNTAVTEYDTDVCDEDSDPRFRRASSVQRQTDSLRRSALRKQREITPKLRAVSPHPGIVVEGGGYEDRRDFRPGPPPYCGGIEVKSYLV